MRHLKTYEGRKKAARRIQNSVGKLGMWQWGIDNDEENIGKYVVLDNYPLSSDNFSNEINRKVNSFISQNIGEITLASKSGYGISYMIKYENIPDELTQCFTNNPQDYSPQFLTQTKNRIDFISDSFKDCETYIETQKYNL